MTFLGMLQGHFSAGQGLELLLRILVATVCGWLVGIERSRRFKDAGIRTHALVAGAAAAMMVISKYGFLEMLELQAGAEGARTADPSRMAAQVISGVGFLGAGAIYRDRRFATRGLTTAAGIWAVAGVGMAVGSGMYAVGLFTTAVIFALQALTHRFPYGSEKSWLAQLELTLLDRDGAFAAMQEEWKATGVRVTESDISRGTDGLVRCLLTIRVSDRAQTERLLNRLTGNPLVQSIRLHEDD